MSFGFGLVSGWVMQNCHVVFISGWFQGLIFHKLLIEMLYHIHVMNGEIRDRSDLDIYGLFYLQFLHPNAVD